MSDSLPPPPPPPPPPFEPPPAAAQPGQQALPYADWGQRFLALLIDGLILLVPTAVVVFGGGFSMGRGMFGGGGFGGGAMLFDITFGGLVARAIQLGYFGFLNGSESGQTVGKRVLGIRVADAQTGESIGYNRGLVREGAVVIAGLISCGGLLVLLDGLWPLWDPQRQTIHDKLVNSVVLKAAS